MPILMGEQLVQPRQLMRRLLAEIDERGGSRSDYFDELAFALEPSLLADRFVDERWLGLEIGPQDCTKDFCYETAPWTSPGWNIKCCEEFEIPTADLTGEYSEWNEWITGLLQPPVQVTGGVALIRQVSCSAPPQCSIGGGISVAGLDIVPDQEFDSEGSSPGDEKNRWTAIQDFRRAGIPQPSASSHTGVFVRVHDRLGWDPENQTHFGCIVYSDGRAALQFEGDDITVPGETEGKQKFVWFSLTENPFDSSHLYRIQTLEREWFHPLEFVWEPWWRAEVHDLTEGGPPIGFEDWIGEWTVENIYGISVPPLKAGTNDSKVGFGLGGGNEDGIDVERTGTSYWVY